MNLIFIGFFVVLSIIYMIMNVYKKNKKGFIVGSACFVFFIFVGIMIYLAQHGAF